MHNLFSSFDYEDFYIRLSGILYNALVNILCSLFHFHKTGSRLLNSFKSHAVPNGARVKTSIQDRTFSKGVARRKK